MKTFFIQKKSCFMFKHFIWFLLYSSRVVVNYKRWKYDRNTFTWIFAICSDANAWLDCCTWSLFMNQERCCLLHRIFIECLSYLYWPYSGHLLGLHWHCVAFIKVIFALPFDSPVSIFVLWIMFMFS